MERRDEELILEYQNGQDEALEALFQRHKKRIFNYALRFLSHRADAEDIVTEVFINAFVGKRSKKC